MSNLNSFGAAATLRVGSASYTIYRLDALEKRGFPGVARLPFSIRVLLENLLRQEDGRKVTAADIEAVAGGAAAGIKEIAFMPARVILQDFTGVPCAVDLAAMREALAKLGADPQRANPLLPADLVIDHSVQVDHFGAANALELNAAIEYQRNRERYSFLRWAQTAFENFRVVPPATGIVHQVNLEYLAPVVFRARDGAAYPDTVVGTDSHTTMINGLGVLGWGVGGIEAEAAMLGQPISMLLPPVVGFRLTGRLPEGSTATDLVLTVTQMLRKKGVVGKFVEFFGPGLRDLGLADRATVANMAPEYGATCGFFPVDEETLELSALHQPARGPGGARRGLLQTARSVPHRRYARSRLLPIRSSWTCPRWFLRWPGPKRPQDRVDLPQVKQNFLTFIKDLPPPPSTDTGKRLLGHDRARRGGDRGDHQLHQHFQSLRHARRGTAGQEGGGKRTALPAVGEDLAGAGFQGGARLSDRFRAAALPRAAWFPCRRLWLHHLHRQQRSAAGEGIPGGERCQPYGGFRAQRQPEL
jgi:aconitate hydratase